MQAGHHTAEVPPCLACEWPSLNLFIPAWTCSYQQNVGPAISGSEVSSYSAHLNLPFSLTLYWVHLWRQSFGVWLKDDPQQQRMPTGLNSRQSPANLLDDQMIDCSLAHAADANMSAAQMAVSS